MLLSLTLLALDHHGTEPFKINSQSHSAFSKKKAGNPHVSMKIPGLIISIPDCCKNATAL